MQIIDAAVIVIAENGYHQAQVSKSPSRPGWRTAPFIFILKQRRHSHLIIQRENGTVYRADERRNDSEKFGDRKAFAVHQKHFELLSSDRHLAIVTQLELRQSNLELRLKINEILKGYLTILEDIITEGKEAGEFKSTLDVRLAKQMIFGTVDETVTTWVMNDQKYDLPNLADSIHELLIHGFSSQKTKEEE